MRVSGLIVVLVAALVASASAQICAIADGRRGTAEACSTANSCTDCTGVGLANVPDTVNVPFAQGQSGCCVELNGSCQFNANTTEFPDYIPCVKNIQGTIVSTEPTAAPTQSPTPKKIEEEDEPVPVYVIAIAAAGATALVSMGLCLFKTKIWKKNTV